MRYNKLKYLSHLFLALVLTISFVSCEQVKSVADDSGLEAKEIISKWVVSEYWLDDEDNLEFGYGPYVLTIYNTSLDQDSIWVDNIYDSGIRVKAGTTSKTTFAVANAVDFNGEFDGTIEISEAKVVNKDSIVFKVTLYKPDGTIQDDYYEAGQRFTGWND